jgi:hypothetical protein
MLLLDRDCRVIFVGVALSALCAFSCAATKPRIIPLQTNISFSSAQSAQSHWSVPIKSTDGRTVYVLSLEPDVYRAGDQHLEALDLALRRPHDKANGPNLLAAIRNWHGVQNFMFPAWDFTQGVRKSIYGEKRTILVKNLGLVVHIAVLKAVVSPSGRNYQLDALDIHIDVDNAPEASEVPTEALTKTEQ